MKTIGMSHVQDCLQMALGIDEGQIVFALECDPDAKPDPNWLVYRADPARAREIAQVLIEGADLIDGKTVDDGRYDANAETFREHDHG